MNNEKVKVQVLGAEQNVFKDKENRTISYCKIVYISGSLDDEMHFGKTIDSTTCKYEYFSDIKQCIKNNQLVEVEFEYVKQRDGSYKRKVKTINGK